MNEAKNAVGLSRHLEAYHVIKKMVRHCIILYFTVQLKTQRAVGIDNHYVFTNNSQQ